jgi:replicative DNA helicase
MASHFAAKAMEAEQAIIGCAMLDDSWIPESGVSCDDFLNESHRRVWGHILSLVDAKQPVDLVTMTERMGRGKDVINYLSDMMRNTPSSANVMAYVGILKRYAEKQRASQVLADAMHRIASDDDVVDSTISALMSLNTQSTRHEHNPVEYLNLAQQHLSDMAAGKIKTMSTGLIALDNMLGGFHDSDLIILAGRPAMGKTAVMLNMALKSGELVGVMSGEQPAEQMAVRMVAMRGRVDMERLRSVKKMEETDWSRVATGFKRLLDDSTVLINDKPMPTLSDIQRQARKWKHQTGIKALFIDYLQRIGGGDSRQPKHERIGEIVKGLKSLARELNIPVIALAQVSRDVEKRPIKIPGMADISDSSEIEKEADQVITLYRDEVYNAKSEEKGIMNIVVCKNRHGSVGMVKTAWLAQYMLAENLAGDERGYGNG